MQPDAQHQEHVVREPLPAHYEPAAPLRVLLVEDSPVIRESVVELIEADGLARVVCATDSEADAIRELTANPYDVYIVDLRLREGSGFGVLRALQESRPDALTIVLTNYTSQAIRKRCSELGVKWFLDKSSEFEAIADLISSRNTRR